MAHSLGKALAGLSAPGKAKAPVRKGVATMTIEPAPKTSFTDKNLAPKPGVPKPFKLSQDNAKPGVTISPERNMPNLPLLKKNPSGISTT